jgi:hypothetical protein
MSRPACQGNSNRRALAALFVHVPKQLAGHAAGAHLAARLACQVLMVWRPAQVRLPVDEGGPKVHQHAHEELPLTAAEPTDAHGMARAWGQHSSRGKQWEV